MKGCPVSPLSSNPVLKLQLLSAKKLSVLLSRAYLSYRREEISPNFNVLLEKKKYQECFLQDVLLSDGIFAEDRISFMLSHSMIMGNVRIISEFYC